MISVDEGDILPSSYNLKRGAICSSETLGFTQKTTRSQNPEDHNKNLHCPTNFKPHMGNPVFLFLSSHDCKRPNADKITFHDVALSTQYVWNKNVKVQKQRMDRVYQQQ
jgi:hypothetical protein